MDIDTLIAALQNAIEAATAFKNQPAPAPIAMPTVVDVKVDESDGSSETLVPEVGLPTTPETTA